VKLEIAPGVHWIGVTDPDLLTFDIILKTANGTSYKYNHWYDFK
jgi:flavorubredoxin